MWQTLINLQIGSHVPYFPGMDWDKVEQYKKPRVNNEKAAEAARKRGDHMRREVLKVLQEICAQKAWATVGEVQELTDLSYYYIGKVLRNFWKDGQINRMEERGSCSRWFVYQPK